MIVLGSDVCGLIVEDSSSIYTFDSWTKLGIVLAVSNLACYNFKLHTVGY